MLILLGYLVVLGTVFGGYLMTGGSLGALYQPAELVIIAGAGIGSFIVGNNGKAIKGTLKALPLLFRRSKYTKAMYMDLLALLYRLMAKSRQMGMFSLERDIENPRESEIFASYPRILADSVMLDFIVDYLRLIISGHMNTFEIEALMDEKDGEGNYLVSQGNHWIAIFRIVVDKNLGASNTDYLGFCNMMNGLKPEGFRVPLKQDNLKKISDGMYTNPFDKWKYDSAYNPTRKPYDKMVEIATRFKEILEENGF